jgi:rhamnulose-1-phosphate aldolase/alcohol dehydrogenase
MFALEPVENHWIDTVAARLDPLDRLVYRSNLLGADWRVTNTGGGNTSSKLLEKDPLTGEPVEVLWVKGSGGDLRTARREHFASLYMDRLRALQDLYAAYPERGPKTPAEDAMVGMYPHTTFNLNPRVPSIDTPLHAFVPYRHVDHTHPVACIALATARDGERLTREIYGDEVIWTDWQRPGFELGLTLQRICREHPRARGVLLGGHGLINWADDDRACYHLTLELINRAATFLAPYLEERPLFGGVRYPALPDEAREHLSASLLPWLRGRLGRTRRVLATVEAGGDVPTFAGSLDAPRLAEMGTSCPDHFLRTRIKPLYVDWNPEQEDEATLRAKIVDGLAKYREDYRTYYERHRRPDSPPMRGADPSVFLIPGIGIVAWGKTKSESRVTAEFFRAAIGVMAGAEAVSEYTALPRQEAFDIEYWQLEEAKLRRMPPEKELSRRIFAVVGGGSGIGRALVRRLVRDGGVVAVLDRDEAAARDVAEEHLQRLGKGIGVAGTGISNCGDLIALPCDVTDRASIDQALRQVTLAYGGLDGVAVTAGLYATPDAEGRNDVDGWMRSFSVNTLGPYLVAEEAFRRWREQQLDAALVIATSVNGIVAKQGSPAYDASKAAANHLVRELAIALAPRVRVNGVAPATVVEGSRMFPRDRVIASLLKYGLPFDEAEDTNTLRSRLSAFYAERTLLQQPITPDDQAEAFFCLLSNRLGKTTGQILTVDGGLIEAFQR